MWLRLYHLAVAWITSLSCRAVLGQIRIVRRFPVRLPYAIGDRFIRRGYALYLATGDTKFLAEVTVIAERTSGSGRRRSVAFRRDVWDVLVGGWAFDANLMTGITDVVLLVDGIECRSRKLRLSTGLRRSDVTAALGLEPSVRPGFRVKGKLESLPETVAVHVQSGGSQREVPVSASLDALSFGGVKARRESEDDERSHLLGFVDLMRFVPRRRIGLPRLVDWSESLVSPSRLAVDVIRGETTLPAIMQEPGRFVRSLSDPGFPQFELRRLACALGLPRALGDDVVSARWRMMNESAQSAECRITLPQQLNRRSRVRVGDSSGFSTTVSLPRRMEVRNCRVVHGHLMIDESAVLLVDEHGARPPLDFVAGQWDSVVGSFTRWNECFIKEFPQPDIQFDAGVFIPMRVPGNYFHSMIEGAPRLLTLSEDDVEQKLMLSSEVPGTVMDAISRLVDSDRIELIERSNSYLVRNLVVPTSHTAYRDSTMEPWWKGAGVYWPVLEEFRSRLMATVPTCDGPDRVFLVRPGSSVNGRGLRNQDHLVEIAEHFGFTPVDPGSLDLDGQVNLIRNAQMVVGPGGASMANLLFAQEGLIVLSLVSHHLRDFAMFSTLATHASATYYTLTGPSNRRLGRTEFHRDVFHGDFWINPREFKNALRQLTQASASRRHGTR